MTLAGMSTSDGDESRWTTINRRRGVPAPSSDAVRRRMRKQRQRDTATEVAVRKELHAVGLRYRLDVRPVATLRRRADIVFPRERVAVFVDGCFWHGCPDHGRRIRSNTEWWASKIAATRARDMDTRERLEEEGWTVVRIWEHDEPRTAARRIAGIVRSKREAEGS